MREAGGKLPERGQAFGAARVGFRAAQLAIRFFQFLRKILAAAAPAGGFPRQSG